MSGAEHDLDALLAEQVEYYRQRAPEYDQWWLREGRYRLDAERRADWDADVAELEAAFDAVDASGDVLELASGTGIWTGRLARRARRLVAVDASAETLELNRARTGGRGVEYVTADLFDWQPPRAAFDLCFFAFWLSHVPRARAPAFWSMVGRALRPDGRVLLIDNGVRDLSSTVRLLDDDRAERTLADGRAFTIVKRYWSPEQLTTELRTLGWRADVRQSANGFFVWATGARAS